jgi:phosphoribosylformylglycinamidine cyclo-ligase
VSTAEYRSTGVDYAVLDRAKREALAAASSTSSLPRQLGATVDDASRGEPAQVVEIGGLRLATVLECLGTKSMLARAYELATGIDRYDLVGYDTVTAIVNDLCCVGALPVTVHAYFATGAPEFYDGTRHASLVDGWRRGCVDAGAAWVGGESPTLPGLIAPGEVDLAGAALGIVPAPIVPWLGGAIAAGDEIVLVASTGLHTNGASLVRRVAAALPDGLLTELASGAVLAEAALAPSACYVGAVRAVQAHGVPIHYASHITGHGLRKLMRAGRDLGYIVSELPVIPEVLSFLVRAAGLDEAAAYGTFNMGAGFAFVVADGAGEPAVDVLAAAGYRAHRAGRVVDGPRRVVLEELGITYGAADLDLR